MPIEAFIFYVSIHVIMGFFFAIASLGAYFRYERADNLQTVERKHETGSPRVSGGIKAVFEMAGFEYIGTVEDTILLDRTGKSALYVNAENPRTFANVFGADTVYLHSLLESKKVIQTVYGARPRKSPKQIAKRYQTNHTREGLQNTIEYHNKELDKQIGKNQTLKPVADLDGYFDTVEWWLNHDFIPFLTWQTYMSRYQRISLILLVTAIPACIAAALIVFGLLASDIPIGTRESLFIASNVGFFFVISASTISVRRTIKNARSKLEGA